MKKVNTKTIILIGILVMICAIAGVSYAVWQITLTQEDDNLITSSCFQVSIDDKNPITLQNTIPFTDEEGKDLTPYTFTIHNECGENALYEINYEILNDTTFENDEDRFIKIMLQEEEPKLLNELTPTEKTLKEANRAYKIEEGYIKANETKEYKLRVWLDKDVTIEDDVMGKSLSSKITITARYDRGIVTSPEVELALSRCSNNIIAQIKTTGNKIESYEYQIDEEEPIIEEKDAYTFENKARGETHKVKVKITDIYGNVTEKEEEINIPDYPTLLGKKIGTEIPLVTSGDGLYEVTHCEGTIENNDLSDEQKEGLLLEEYRYAGSNPNNYIKFNNETWRIIGLVNVLTTNNTVEQRVKIIKNESIGEYSWDTSSTSVNSGYGVNEWSESDLMKLLNPGYDTNKKENADGSINDTEYVNNSLYWNGQSGICYNDYSNSTIECNFQGKDLKKSASFIAEDIIWNIGSPKDYTIELVNDFFTFERSNRTAKECDNNEDNMCNDDVKRTTKWNGKVGLIYPSDYGYATGGEFKEKRDTCLTEIYQEDIRKTCTGFNWLYISNDSSDSQWTLSPMGKYGYHSTTAISGTTYNGLIGSWASGNYKIVRPTLYLRSNVIIQNDNATGGKESPYELIMTE